MADKIIFLDFDGVLNSADWLASLPEREIGSAIIRRLDNQAVEVLNQIIEQTGAQVVISSTWRLGHRLVELREILEKHGFKGEVIGTTPDGYKLTPRTSLRGHEIQKWLDKTAYDVKEFVIIDDDADMAHLKPKLVQTDFQEGLRPHHIDKVLEHLSKKST